MKRVVVTLALAACRSAAPPDGCTSQLSGNFVETATSPRSCPTLIAGAGASRGDTLLDATIPSAGLGSNFAISLDLGASPTPGAYSSATTDLWSARGVKSVAAAGACVVLASNHSTPNGDFTLELSSIAPLHGTLRLRMFVLPRASATGVQSDCGAGTTEQLQLTF